MLINLRNVEQIYIFRYRSTVDVLYTLDIIRMIRYIQKSSQGKIIATRSVSMGDHSKSKEIK